jgi:hypothetical protein
VSERSIRKIVHRKQWNENLDIRYQDVLYVIPYEGERRTEAMEMSDGEQERRRSEENEGVQVAIE